MTDSYISCIAHPSSEGGLLAGDGHAALFDCGMLFCARDTISSVKAALHGRSLDYIFATHTHYDHIGALPAFRAEWPGLRLVNCEAGAAVLLKDTPRRVIREFSATAADLYGASVTPYSDDDFHVDMTVKEHDRIPLGGLTVQVIETPGHTRDSLSFFVEETGLLILSETAGVPLPAGKVGPAYLTGFNATAASIGKCSALPYKHLSLPHHGLATQREADGYFERAMEAAVACRDFIVGLHRGGYSDDEILEQYVRKFFSPELEKLQPRPAFTVNARATINCTLREYGDGM